MILISRQGSGALHQVYPALCARPRAPARHQAAKEKSHRPPATKNGGIAICAPIAPYRADRRFNREMITPLGGYIEIFVNTPLDVCERRDVKGLYTKARQGLIKQFTGIDDPYEAPKNPDIDIDTTNITVEEATLRIIDYLEKAQLI